MTVLVRSSNPWESKVTISPAEKNGQGKTVESPSSCTRSGPAPKIYTVNHKNVTFYF